MVLRLFSNLLPHDFNEGLEFAASTTSSQVLNLKDSDLKNGLHALIDYLIEIRCNLNKERPNSVNHFSHLPQMSIIDTTLLKCYIYTNESLIAPLLRRNNCNLEESEKILKKYQKYEDLIILYQTKGHHQKALQLLRTHANMANSPLAGHKHTIQYLQTLDTDNKALIFEFASWVLENHLEEGLKVFIDNIQDTENQLERGDVLHYLLKCHKTLVIPYLVHIINELSETKPFFHNMLVQQYIEQIGTLVIELKSNSTGGADK